MRPRSGILPAFLLFAAARMSARLMRFRNPRCAFAVKLPERSRETGAVVLMTGATALLSDGQTAYAVHHGHPMMSRITGSGCMLSALTAAYLAVRPEQPLSACLTVLCAAGLAGEIAASRMRAEDGNASFRNFLTDAVFNLTEQQLREGARYEIFR